MFWNPEHVYLLVGSVLFNYFVGVCLQKYSNNIILCFGICMNVLMLLWFKYLYFIADNLDDFITIPSDFEILLPIGISFYTLQQIAWLVDSKRGVVKDRNFLSYSLFVTFFPQLIAGPIIHHAEVIPQYSQNNLRGKILSNLAIGSVFFIVGLAKKVLISDRLAPFANYMFNSAEVGDPVGFFGAWAGVLAYSLQLYFDFSAYSDMAIGIAVMAGFRFPLNFNAPYRAVNIQDFWRRWHMTLSRFMKDYLYIPLGGNRKGKAVQAGALLITMLVGGAWHGAGWNFILWGFLHGAYLVIHNLYAGYMAPLVRFVSLPKAFWIFVTFFFVVLAWVPFRSESLAGAFHIYQNLFMLGGNPGSDWATNPLLYGVPETIVLNILSKVGISGDTAPLLLQYLMIGFYACLVWLTPTTAQIMRNYYTPLGDGTAEEHTAFKIRWKPGLFWLTCIFGLLVVCIIFMRRQAPFLYFQF